MSRKELLIGEPTARENIGRTIQLGSIAIPIIFVITHKYMAGAVATLLFEGGATGLRMSGKQSRINREIPTTVKYRIEKIPANSK